MGKKLGRVCTKHLLYHGALPIAHPFAVLGIQIFVQIM